MACNILYKGNGRDIARALKNYLRGGPESAFIDSFIDGDVPKKFRYTKTQFDSADELLASIKAFDEALLEEIDKLSYGKPTVEAKLLKLQRIVQEKLHFDLDESLSGAILESEESTEAKNSTEIRDINAANLSEHIKEIYGTEAYEIIKGLKELFGDDTTAAAYWDINSGEIVYKNDTILNYNFNKLKNKYYAKIVKFLKSVDSSNENLLESMYVDGKFIGSEYFRTIGKFFTLMKLNPEQFRKSLVQEQSKKIRGDVRSSKELLYLLLVKFLDDSNEGFHKYIRNRYTNRQMQGMLSELYTADYYSKYYNDLKNYIRKHNIGDIETGLGTIQEIINKIESSDLSILDAANAYTSLTHFDELLQELHGKSFQIESGMEGIETGDINKYHFHKDTSHEKKSWQLSEAIDSERYIANLTRQVLSQIRIFDYKTDTFKNRRANSTAFIVAARNLINDISYNNIKWAYPTGSQRDKFDDFIKLTISLHSDPEVKFSKVLEYLFDTVNGNLEPYYYKIRSRKLLTDYDMDMLYSIYNAVYNTSNPNSLRSLELKGTKLFRGTVLHLVLEISGFVDRNTTMDYLETSYDMETGLVQLKVKKKFFNNRLLYKTRVSINRNVNRVTASKSKALRDKYSFLVYPSTDGKAYYGATINGLEFILRVPDSGGRILSNNNSITYEDNSPFDAINAIDLVAFREKIISSLSLTLDEQLLRSMIEFIDDHLGLQILENPEFNLSVLSTYKTIYNPRVDKVVGKNFMMPLMLLAIRAAYANSKYADAYAQEKTLAEYLSSIENEDDGIYKVAKNSTLFSQKYGNVLYTIASFNDEVLEIWTDARSMLKGEASKATTKDKLGNSIPNNSVNKLGSILHHYLLKLLDGNTNSLLFVKDYTLIRSTFHDLEVTTWNNDSKAIRDFSGGELFFHGIFNKFWGNYLSTGNVVVQPTTYSDKTTFLNYEVSTKLDGGKDDILQSDDYQSKAIYKCMDTIGEMYKRVWNDTKHKLHLIADIYNKEHGTMLNFKSVMKEVNEDLLKNLALRAGVELELDKDYRILKKTEVVNGVKVTKSFTAPNETLLYYAEALYSSTSALRDHLNTEKINFVSNLLDANSSFLVIDFGDSVENYISDKISNKANSKNAIIGIIKDFYKNSVDKRKEFFENWVDLKTGKLIIAKLGSNNIIGVGNNFNPSKAVELNPLLDRFFYIEGLLSNNLRMSLTGSEINHPDKAFDTLFNLVKKSDRNDPVALIIKDLDYVGDIPEYIHAMIGMEEVSEDEEKIINELEDIYNKSMLTIVNVAQGTQFKRNVIIPATLLYCLLNVKDGIPPTVKCAVIRDVKAPVYNYRGDHEKDIDSADGAAYINPFLSILENKSLGSQAVGFTKKPIWHSYDINGGTAFLAKFATNTITNELMNSSTHSSINMLKLFKKMTNMLWLGDVNLTHGLTYGELSGTSDLNIWFNTVILGNAVIKNDQGYDEFIINNRLLYKDAYGDIIEISGLNKTMANDATGNKVTLYYTEEKPYTKRLNMDTLTSKVYHLFYDVVDDNGNVIETSKHVTFDTYLKALKFLETLDKNRANVRTINSLYELHTSLGGINNVTSDGTASEFVNEVVVNYMNNIGSIKEGFSSTKNIINLNSYSQPLKLYHIGYALNNTAVKNGAKNINQSSAWSDDSNLGYFEVDSDGLGMLMNADHDIIDSELTEFSQVVTATSAYGYTHAQCNEIFQGLAAAALLASKKALDSVDNFLKANFEGRDLILALSDLYDAIGRIILTNQQIKDKESLLGIIMEAVTKVFYKSRNHLMDEAKIPFSDANIYSDFIATLASTINKLSIKRKHPGSGCVIVPAYNIVEYFEVDGKKLMAYDIVELAREEYKKELLGLLTTIPGYNAETNSIIVGEEEDFINNQPVKSLEELLSKHKVENTSQYYYNDGISALLDSTAVRNFLISKYLQSKQKLATIHLDKSWFMPSDIVNIIGADGNLIRTLNLDNLSTYYDFKDGKFDVEGCLYQVNVTSPRNLKPSLIRWLYLENENDPNSRRLYMNIFDTPVIKESYLNPAARQSNYRLLILKVLHNLHEGIFTDSSGMSRSVLQGTLENEAAELIMSNLYKDKFGIEGESLNTILSKGEDYFYNKFKKLNSPANTSYDMVFLKDSGQHTLISLATVKPNDYIREKVFDPNELYTDLSDNIYLMKGSRLLFKVGKWLSDSSVTFDPNSKLFVDGKGIPVPNLTQYRLKNVNDLTSVLKRINYVNRYSVTDKVYVGKGKVLYKTNTLYELADIKTFLAAKGSILKANEQRSLIISDIYSSDEYKLLLFNINKNWSEGKKALLNNAISGLRTNTYIPDNIKELFNALLSSIQTTEYKKIDDISEEEKEAIGTQLQETKRYNRELYKTLLDLFLREEAHKKWVSFQDSLNFIAARIPAQTLQSFMTMKTVAWTLNSKNMAYVSHFLTYLLGSDYDIDKAYIMGLSYDSNSVYIKWSNLFDFTSVKTLEASKQLPIPKGITIVNDTVNGLSVDSEVELLIRALPQVNSEAKRIEVLQLYAEILRKAESNNGAISYTGNNTTFTYILKQLNNHEYYKIPQNVAESAFKNVASANIYAVSHDIRNRDLAYTAISMDILKDAAKNSPKGNLSEKLNMFNPLTKYVMLYQNLVGKNVISIAANGEKVWFNAYYYWHLVLKNGDAVARERLKFRHTFTRISGRGAYLKNKLVEIQPATISHLPDLNYLDQKIHDLLVDEFGATNNSLDYKYVDLLISLLLSAATDNAKELILAKINSGTNLARMYVYSMMMGFNIDDIVAFMTSPVAEFVDQMSASNMFQNDSIHNNASLAINLTNGIVGVSRFFHGTVLSTVDDPETGQPVEIKIPKKTYVLNMLNNIETNLFEAMKASAELAEDELFTGLGLAMLAYITVVTQTPLYNAVDLRDYINSSDTEINSYIEYCLDLVEKLRAVNNKYDSVNEFREDIKEFKRLYELSTEISTISSAWLGLNLGLPTDKLGILKRLMSMSKIFSSRELALLINAKDMYTDKSVDSPAAEKARRKKGEVIKNIIDNNPTLVEVETRLDAAYEAGIINNFDIVEYFKNKEYREKAKDYFGLIMGTLNVLDMMDVLPLYKTIIDCFNTLLVADSTLASKSRLINKIVIANGNNNLTDLLLKGIIRYIDKLNIVNFVKDEIIPIDPKTTVEGFNTHFLKIQTNKIELDTIEGLATFKHWIENEFYDMLKSELKNPSSELYGNGAIKHMTIVPDNDKTLLAMDIDLLNPEVTTSTREAYDEILRGMSDLEKIKFDNDYTYADVLLLYNLVVNSNNYGDERLTTSFKVCNSPNNVLNRYLKYTSTKDYDFNTDVEYDYVDYLINAAPIISTYSERFHTEEFIKVNDPVRGLILKKLGNDNQYREYEMIPAVVGEETYEEKLHRIENYAINSPVEMPHTHNSLYMIKTVDFDEDFDSKSVELQKLILDEITSLIGALSVSSKLKIQIDC